MALPVLALACLIMSLSYFALASGQAVESFETLAELDCKTEKKVFYPWPGDIDVSSVLEPSLIIVYF